MRLHLKNFGCWSNKEFLFPDNQITLLSGKSGKGKSSIIKAIIFALFGTGNKLVTFGKQSCTVELNINNMYIKRNKGPCKLIVKENDKVMEDDEAQAHITKVIGSNIFYLEQGNKNNFLLMNSTDKLEYLESLIYRDLNISDIKTRINNQIKNTENILTEKKLEINFYNDELNNLNIVNNVSVDNININKNNINEEIKNNELRLESIIKEYRESEEHLKKYLELNNKIIGIQNKIINVTDKRNDLKSDINSLNKDELENTLIQNTNLLEYLELIKKRDIIKSKLEKAQSTFNEFKDEYESVDIELQNYKGKSPSNVKIELSNLKSKFFKIKKYNELKSEYDIINKHSNIQNLESYKQELKSYSIMKCPNCNIHLELKDDTLNICQHSLVSNTTNTSKEELNNKIKNINKSINKLEFLNEELNKYKVNEECNIEELSHSIDKLEKKLYDYEKSKILRDEKLRVLDKIRKKLSLSTKEVDEFQNILNNINNKLDTFLNYDNTKDPKEVMELVNKIKFDIQKYSDISDKIKKCDCELTVLNQELYNTKSNFIIYTESDIKDRLNNLMLEKDKLHLHINNLYKYKIYLDYMDKRLSLENKLTELNEISSRLESDLLNFKEFKTKIIEAQSISLNILINQINQNVQYFLDKFFVDDPLFASIQIFKEVKNVKKSQINIDILYKNNNISMNNLSGGERDRLILAFTLAISEFNSSSFLFLDECLSSLDQETSEIVYGELKSYFKDKLILIVAHQVITGVFDNVLHIE